MTDQAPQLPVSPQEVQIEPPSFWDKLKIHKIKILGGVFGLLFFVGAVFGAYRVGQRQALPESAEEPTPTPAVVTTPTPEPTVTEVSRLSPTPITIEKIPYQPIASWQIYTDSQAKFSVQYPKTYKLSSSTPGTSVNFLSCVDDPQRGEICMAGYSIGISYDYDGGSRREWLFNKNPQLKDFLIDPYFQDIMVVNSKALVIMDGNTGGSTGSWVLVPRENMMYLFAFLFGWNPDTKEKPGFDFIKQVLSTFRFLE